MENWKERFEYIYVVEESKGEKYLRKYDHTTIVEELEYFISQELSKAREEGRREVLEEINRTLGTNIKYINGEYRVVFRRVSKLKDNK